MTSPQTAHSKKKMGLGKKVLVAFGGFLAFLVLVGTCSSGSDDKKADAGSSPKISAAAGNPDTPPTPEGPKPPSGVTFHTEPGTDGEIVFAQFKIKDNFTKGLIKSGAQFETIDILKYARQAYPDAAKVFVQGSFPMTDNYGNTTNDVILNVGYTKATLDKINFDGISSENIWNIRDSGMVHPELRK